MSDLKIERVAKCFGGFRALNEIDLEIADGEFVALVGPSGCGKSTLLRLVAGLEQVDRGQIEIGGRVVNALSPRERNIAMVFQSYALYPHMTIEENISFNLRLARRSRLEIKQKLVEAATMLNLGSLLNRRPEQLSGGQRQRVAMGRALVRDPDVFLFDEPLSNLDAKLRGQMRTEIKAFHQKVRRTCLYVTHDQIEAMTLADRIVVLEAGNIRQQGKPLELYNRPANRFVAGFIGSPPMNFVRGTLRRSAEGWHVEVGNGVTVAVVERVGVRQGQVVTIGIRPERIVPANDQAALAGRVLYVEPTGAQTHVTIEWTEHLLLAVVDASTRVSPGDNFCFSVAPEAIHLFDEESGERLPELIAGQVDFAGATRHGPF